MLQWTEQVSTPGGGAQVGRIALHHGKIATLLGRMAPVAQSKAQWTQEHGQTCCAGRSASRQCSPAPCRGAGQCGWWEGWWWTVGGVVVHDGRGGGGQWWTVGGAVVEGGRGSGGWWEGQWWMVGGAVVDGGRGGGGQWRGSGRGGGG